MGKTSKVDESETHKEKGVQKMEYDECSGVDGKGKGWKSMTWCEMT